MTEQQEPEAHEPLNRAERRAQKKGKTLAAGKPTAGKVQDTQRTAVPPVRRYNRGG